MISRNTPVNRSRRWYSEATGRSCGRGAQGVPGYWLLGKDLRMDSSGRAAGKGSEDPDCWKAGRHATLFVAKETVPALPKEERSRLGDQRLRAARSITANIAEGYGRFHNPDHRQFCRNARGPAFEVRDHLITACDEGLVAKASLNAGREKIETAVKPINGEVVTQFALSSRARHRRAWRSS